MKNALLFGISIISFLVIASCATLTQGTKQTVTINSNVDGAQVYLEGAQIGTTPFVGEIPKNKEALTIQKDGYRTHTLSFSKSLEPIFWGNIISGGTIGSLTDFVSGAAYSYSPSSYQVEMYRDGESDAAFMQRFELRKYAMTHITDISVDLGNDGGEHLKTLINLAELTYDDASIDLIKSKFAFSQGNEIIFGNEVVELI
ncbi:PEGA domain-containing protein [Rhodohalobacter sp. SW132]|uniref:PEGA domain-containing protein n=1 Tax=Rhodohalobacter sp. SW132 TaxID=2293433 RepID=UPI000E2652B8|nr:PEGA domain-containing protein [Rhodohalobacter sp. SW132]REL24834.1 PEGA domain-containing protein [Rhodohalobacter sp. SW132]